MGTIFRKTILVLFLLLAGITAYPQESETDGLTEIIPQKGDFWISPGVEMAMYNNMTLGYSLALGYGKGASIGIKVSYYPKTEDIAFMEFLFLLRVYFLGASAYSGPFLQLSGGPTLVDIDGNLSFPEEFGILSGGISFGWRFLFNDRFFIEPSIRGGYPYMFGAGFSAGVRF
jgi:hypothetical protein